MNFLVDHNLRGHFGDKNTQLGSRRYTDLFAQIGCSLGGFDRPV
jgi:hypothetical protein